MTYFKSILHFAKPYMGYAWLNIIANIFYALFGTLAFVSLMPMLKVLFQNATKINIKPTYEGIGNIGGYFEDLMNYYITQKIDSQGELYALSPMITLVISTFLLKNLFKSISLLKGPIILIVSTFSPITIM